MSPKRQSALSISRANRRGRASLPDLPSLPGLRQPAGYGLHDIAIKAQGFRGAADLGTREPAGDPPEEFPGTRPEWAVFWALQQLGLTHGSDFYFAKFIGGLAGSMPWSQIDFVLYDWGIGIEVQGEFWHNSMGHAKIEQDVYRAAQAASLGLHIVFIDEQDALRDPIWYVEEALAGVDHSSNLISQ